MIENENWHLVSWNTELCAGVSIVLGMDGEKRRGQKKLKLLVHRHRMGNCAQGSLILFHTPV